MTGKEEADVGAQASKDVVVRFQFVGDALVLKD